MHKIKGQLRAKTLIPITKTGSEWQQRPETPALIRRIHTSSSKHAPHQCSDAGDTPDSASSRKTQDAGRRWRQNDLNLSRHLTQGPLRNLLTHLLACLAILYLGASQVSACVEGLEWGMTLDQVTAHLGATRQADPDQPQKYQALNARLDEIPVIQSTFELTPETGLRTLAYEFEVSDMTEVLAGLRHRYGQPLSMNIEDRQVNQQLWVWNTGEDLVTAVNSNSVGRQQFLISYRPSRLRPNTL